ncbi:transcriptional regulator, LuxR family [Actinobacteria bacterium OK074]|nr:transcriptional regulator, LuxR family [Actinobacteria bacterium OK074]
MNLALALPDPSSPPSVPAPARSPAGRAAPLSALVDRVPRGASGPACAVLLTGAVGIGRSTLLRAFCEAQSTRASVLRAGPLDGTWYDAADAARSDAAPVQTPLGAGVLSSSQLHKAVAERARRGPVVLVMDDAHRPRPRSLHALDYVLRRCGTLPLLLVVTVPDLPGTAEPYALTSLLAHHTWTTLKLAPLAADDVAEVLTRRLNRRPGAALLRRCLEQTGGVPAAVHGFADRFTAPDTVTAGPGDAQSAPPASGPLPRSASVVLSAVAVLGCADPELVSELLRMPLPTVHRAMERLAAHRALPDGSDDGPGAPVRHVPHGIPGDELAPMYPRAARLLEDAGRPPTQVADVLLRVRSGAAPWMLEALHSAALAADTPGSAVVYLAHALDIGADLDALALRRIRARLARILATSAPAAALPHLSVLLATSTDGRELADVALRYADTLVALGRGDEAARLLARVLDPPAASGARTVTVPDECRPGLEEALLLSGSLRPGTLGWVRERSQEAVEPVGNSPGTRRLRLARTALSVLGGRSAPLPGAPLLRAVATPDTPLEDLSRIAAAVIAHLGDDHAAALDTLDRILRRPAREGLDPSRAKALMVRALVLSGTGDLPAAERDCRQAVALPGRLGAADDADAAPAVVLAHVLAQRGRTAAADAVLAGLDPADLRPLFYVHPLYWWTRAAVRRSRGDLSGALVALRAAGRTLSPAGAESAAVLPWWLEAAEVLTELGRPAEARRVAARGCAPDPGRSTARGAGLALLARGLATPGRSGRLLLDEACGKLAESPARLLWARAEHALGAALLDAGDPRAARPRLRTALDLMIGCGAGCAAEGVRTRLAEAGGRPRPITGRPGDALTHSERRVAALAMEGRSNREIAEALYITRRTVELHLTHAYQKLGVNGREDLTAVLGGSPAAGGSLAAGGFPSAGGSLAAGGFPAAGGSLAAGSSDRGGEGR